MTVAETAPVPQPTFESEASSSTLGSSVDNKDSTVEKQRPEGGVFRKGGTFPTMICLSKAAVGAGVLSMSVHAAQVGLVFQLVALTLGALLTWVSIRMVAWSSVETRCWSYEDICEELFHPSMSLLTGFMNVCNCLGAGAGYLIVCGQVFQVCVQSTDMGRNLFVLCVGVFICGPLALARHVSFMRHLAAMSVACLLFLVFAVVYYYADNGPDETVTTQTLSFGPGGASVFTYMNALSNIVFAYNNQFNVPQLTGEITPQPSVRRMSNVATATVVLCVVLYGVISVFGLLAFGVGKNQGDSLVIDLAPDRKNLVVLAAMIGVMFSVLTCFQFHIYPIRQFSAYAVRKIRARDSEQDDDVNSGGRTLTRWLDIATALGSVAVVILIALVVTSLKKILNFVGAFAAAWISFVVPPLWVIQLLRRKKDFRWSSVESLGCMALFGLGAFFFIFGTYSAVSDAING
jgi:amino acid permease